MVFETIVYITPYLCVYIFLGFIFAILLKRNDLADVLWGPGIFMCAYLGAHKMGSFSEGIGFALLLCGIWALRIFFHIGSRFLLKKEEDFRYATWRKDWKYFYTRSFFQIFLLQGFLMLIMSTLFWGEKESGINFFTVLGVLVALLGLTFETLADWQLKKFLQQKTGGILKTGVWSLTRHPNYFGEVTFWWGLFLLFFNDFLLYGRYGLIISPLLITFLILKVSGIPTLEKKYSGNKEWKAYAKKTPAFFPKLF